jgi:hypothetical protein
VPPPSASLADIHHLDQERAVTEAEWLACTDPGPVLELVTGRTSDRKLRLFACACLRRVQHLPEDPCGRAAVEVAERFADGSAGRQELALTWHAVRQAQHAALEGSAAAHALDATLYVTEDRPFSAALEVARLAAQAAGIHETAAAIPALAREIAAGRQANLLFSFRAWQEALATAAREAIERVQEVQNAIRARERSAQAALLREVVGPAPFRRPVVDSSVLAWNDACVVKLARAIYDGLAWDRLPVLADALEEAACTDADVLRHCRQPGDHVRGCWVVDSLLGKE